MNKMNLTNEQLIKLSKEYYSKDNPSNFGYGFMTALSVLGVSSEQRNEISIGQIDEQNE